MNLALSIPFLGIMLVTDPVFAMNDMDDQRLTVMSALEVFEGFRSEAYIDTTGHLTIGYGHKLPAEYIAHAPVTEQQAWEMLRADVEAAEEGVCRVFPDAKQLPYAAQEALTHMCFQLGVTGLSRFVNLKKAIALKNWSLAGAECIHSRWCQLTPKRARFCAALFGSIK